MRMIKLLGILIIILGFSLKLDSILIIMLSAIVTAVAGGLTPVELLTTLGETFVNNRSMAIFILIMFVTGTLERNGLKEAAAKLIGKIKNPSSGKVIAAYGVMRGIFGAFNVSFGGVAGFVQPIIMPMATGAVEATGNKINEEHEEEIKGMASAMENIAWFFCQVLFVGGSGGLLIQGTLAELGYEVNLASLAKVAIVPAVVAIAASMVYFIIKDKMLVKKYYNKNNNK
ncbi:MAG: DUF969 family protein [bacterium]|nr:DUF969 family protein [bacterium]